MNRKAILIAAVLSILITSQSVTAQTTKGQWLFEGNIGNLNFFKSKSQSSINNLNNYIYKSEDQNTRISIYPRVGYFISNNLVVGTTLNYTFLSNKSTTYWANGLKNNEGYGTSSSIGLSPFLRYYLIGKNSKNKLYAQIGGGMNINPINKSKSIYYDSNGEVNQTFFNITKGQSVFGEVFIGFNHFFNDHVAFNTALGYNYNSSTQTNYQLSINSYKGTASYTYLSHNIVWNFGFTILIPHKKQS